MTSKVALRSTEKPFPLFLSRSDRRRFTTSKVYGMGVGAIRVEGCSTGWKIVSWKYNRVMLFARSTSTLSFLKPCVGAPGGLTRVPEVLEAIVAYDSANDCCYSTWDTDNEGA